MSLRPKLSAARPGVAALISAGLLCGAFGAVSEVAAGSPATTAHMATPTPNLIRNGTFAIPKYFEAAAVLAGGPYQIPGWVEGVGGVIDLKTSYVQAPSGSAQSVKLFDNTPGSLTQTVKTTPGTTYLLQWYGAG